MSGVTLAVISAFFWALGAILIRKGVRDVDTMEAAYISSYASIALLVAVSLVDGNGSALFTAPWAALAAFAAAGIASLSIARFLYFLSVRNLGPSRTTVFMGTRVIVAPLLGVVFLGEAFTMRIAVGGVVMFIGLTILTMESS